MIYQRIQVKQTMDSNLSHILQVLSQETMLCSQTRHPMGETEQGDVPLTDILTYMQFILHR